MFIFCKITLNFHYYKSTQEVLDKNQGINELIIRIIFPSFSLLFGKDFVILQLD